MGGAVQGTVTQETQMTDGTRGVINTLGTLNDFPKCMHRDKSVHGHTHYLIPTIHAIM